MFQQGMVHESLAWMTSLIVHYGLVGLFVSSFIGSTLFLPFSVEAMLPILIGLNLDIVQIVLVACVGATLGTCVNYGIGFFAAGLVEKRLGEESLKNAKNILDKYGWLGLFLIIAAPLPLPIPVDPVTVIPGLARMNFRDFILVIFCAKLVKYTIFAAVSMGIISMLHI